MFRIRQAAKREMQIATTTTITKTTSTKRFGVWTWNDARKTKIARQKTAKRNKRIYKTHTHTRTPTKGPNTNTNAQAAAESSVRYSNNNNNNEAIKTYDKDVGSAAAAGKKSSFICFIHHSIKRTPRRRRHLKHLAVWWVCGYFAMPSLPVFASVQQCLFFSPYISPSSFCHVSLQTYLMGECKSQGSLVPFVHDLCRHIECAQRTQSESLTSPSPLRLCTVVTTMQFFYFINTDSTDRLYQ